MCELSTIPGLADLRKQTIGDERIRVAVLDGPVDLGHPVFANAEVRQEAPFGPEEGVDTASAEHGTAVASVIFGGQTSAVPGVAPRCRGLTIPVFAARGQTTSQLELARAIEMAIEAGVQLINISGGQLTESGAADDVLAKAVRYCRDRGVLVLAAAGNDGCFCMHVPAALPSVIAVGAMDDTGQPMYMSNWGPAYQGHGLLAPGENVRCAVAGGGANRKSGTSLATPIVTGVAALLLSLQLRSGREPDPLMVGKALLESADPCDLDDPVACLRFLSGKLNIERAVSAMSTNETNETAVSTSAATGIDPLEDSAQSCACSGHVDGGCSCAEVPADVQQTPEDAAANAQQIPETDVPVPSASLSPSMAPAPEVVTSAENSYASLVYAIGTLGFDFGTEARRDSFKQQMKPKLVSGAGPFSFSDRKIEEATIRKVQISTSDGRHTITGGDIEYAFVIEDKQWKGISGGRITYGVYRSGELIPDDKNPGQRMLTGGYIDEATVSDTTYSVQIAANPYDPEQMLEHLVKRPDEAKALIWTLNLELTPIYSYEPRGPYAAAVYDEFVLVLAGQLVADGHNVEKIAGILDLNPRFAERVPRKPGGEAIVARIERAAVAGRLSGRTVKLFSGQAVPVVDAEQPRGVLAWNVSKLIEEATTAALRAQTERPKASQVPTESEEEQQQKIEDMLREFLNRIYFDLRNLGTTSQDRALNAGATNAFQMITPLASAVAEGKMLDSVGVEKSPYGRVDSDSWDVKLRFFDPENNKKAKRVARLTVDVGDLLPVTVGVPRTWQES